MCYLIVDLEATCSRDNAITRQEMEIIEIGAVIADKTFNIIAEFSTFVRPVRHPVLTEFCTQLTTITQQQVECAPTYPDAFAAFQAWLSPYDIEQFCSWGAYDLNQFRQDCALHGIQWPIMAPHFNLKIEFAKRQRLPKLCGLSTALHYAKLPFMGTLHRGIDDARNMVQLLPFIVGDVCISFY